MGELNRKDLARYWIYDLVNDADHVASVAKHVQASLRSGDLDDALGLLRQIEGKANLGWRLEEAVRAIEAAKQEV